MNIFEKIFSGNLSAFEQASRDVAIGLQKNCESPTNPEDAQTVAAKLASQFFGYEALLFKKNKAQLSGVIDKLKEFETN